MAELTNRPPAGVAELERRWVAAGMVVDHPVREVDLREVAAFLPRWARLADADTDERRVQLVNELLAECTAHPRVTDHGGEGWHIHFRDDGLPMAAVLRVATSMATARHLTERGMHRMGRCALAECVNVFVDDTRGGRQRYCSVSCANRDAVRRHRAKRSTGRAPAR
ncbi:MAG TPA: CGNR zinc finger domain-containing protein [Pseudonocardia sp.]|nr:CGNR zinc finger domain-containing protein [Pseudonocardia sp.]